MNIIETIVPISIDNLKKYFTDKNTSFIIDYNKSSLKGNKFLTYISNLDIPCDVILDDSLECQELIKDYMHFSLLCTIPSLEKKVIKILLEYRDINNSSRNTNFIKENLEIIERWASVLDSLTLYNMYIIKSEEFKTFVKTFPEDDTSDITGINFLSLLHHEDFYMFYNKIDQSKLKFYSTYFDNYIFKGKNLFSFWANENNPLFLLTWGIANNIHNERELNVPSI